MIKIENLTKVYDERKQKVYALKDINLEVEKGEIFGIIGLSGAGKSTLIRCINRLEEPTSGNIIINDTNITTLNKKELRNMRKKVGMIFQHFNLLSSKTVFDNIAFPLEISGYTKAEIKARVKELLEVVELIDKKDFYPSQLSGGQKQRVAIARALANKPDILLCDEATSALDPKTTKSILNLIKTVQSKFGLTVLLITHEMEVIKEICDRVAVIEEGQIIEINTVENFFSNPQTKTARTFISSLHNNDEEIEFDKLPNSKVLKLSFLGEVSKKPVITQLIRNFSIDVNILSGNINELQKTSVGHLIVQILGKENELINAINWLKNKNIGLEVIWNG